MTASCASCRYPLNVYDSVACHECNSHFHIDCAQLVGFPLFELSAEPIKNTFHCLTCQLLPLPVPRGDSDTSDDEGMPTRQLDYTLEGDSDSGKNMNEVKGTIQDLSELCKDMLREINDLKSINLTLRCCVENLRHDNEERDNAILDLKRRLDLLEGKHFESKIVDSCDQLSEKYIKNEIESVKIENNESSTQNTSYSNKSAAYKHGLFSKYTTTSKEETEGFELEETLPKEEVIENLIKNTTYNQQSSTYKKELFSHYTTTSKEETEGYELEESSSIWEKDEDSQPEKSKTKQLDEAEIGYSDDETDEGVESQIKKHADQTKELVKAEIISETNESRKDWSWKGSQAVELSKLDDESEEEEEESEDEIEEKETPSWKKLKEEIESAMKEDDDVKASTEVKSVDTEEKEDLWKVRKSVTWDENIEDETDTETELSQRGPKHDDQSEAETETIFSEDVTDEVGSVADLDDRLEAGEDEFRLESREGIIEEEDRLESEEVFPEEQRTLEVSEELAEGESRLEFDRPVTEGEPAIEGDITIDGEPRLDEDGIIDVETRLEGEIEVEGEPRLEGDELLNDESRLEGDVIVDGEAVLDGEPTGDEEHRIEGTDYPDEEEVQPPESPSPVHTEEDLWLYLKENVSSERPSTVEEFVRNLIGTLQHVPEEYLKPVIDANIKRANSPSVTDGDHLPTPEGIRSEEGEIFEEGTSTKNEDINSVNPTETTDSAALPASTQEVSFPGGTTVLEATD